MSNILIKTIAKPFFRGFFYGGFYMRDINKILKEIRGIFNITPWANAYGRKNGIYGSGKHKGYNDDLDTFRHVFMSAL